MVLVCIRDIGLAEGNIVTVSWRCNCSAIPPCGGADSIHGNSGQSSQTYLSVPVPPCPSVSLLRLRPDVVVTHTGCCCVPRPAFPWQPLQQDFPKCVLAFALDVTLGEIGRAALAESLLGGSHHRPAEVLLVGTCPYSEQTFPGFHLLCSDQESAYDLGKDGSTMCLSFLTFRLSSH